MRQDIYEFNPDDVYRFAASVGARTKTVGNNLQFKYCPYCNGGRRRDKATFAISLKTGQFKCQRGSCGVKGNLFSLVHDFGFVLNEEYAKYRNLDNVNGKYKKFADAHKVHESKPAAIEYMESRGIPERICRQYEITTNSDGNIVFPFKDEDGALQFIKYRAINRKDGKSKEWCERNCKPILFGMNHCNTEESTLIITEGQIDSLSVATVGFTNAVSVPLGKDTFSAWLPHCWNWLQNFKRIIVFGDYENGEMSLLNYLNQRIKFAQIWHVRFEDYKDCKDANEILKKYGADQVRHCIEYAEIVPLQQVIDMADVTEDNPYDVPKLPTGIYPIDRLLHGGLPFGGVTVISGKAGEGKSTFANQLLLYALKSGYKSFVYSGELTNSLLKAWIMQNAAGPEFCIKEESEYGYRYSLSEGVKTRINNWLRGNMYMYDNSSLLGVNEMDSLCELITKTIQCYGVKVLLIDNLMTAIDLEESQGSTQYERQSAFMRKLYQIALQYEVIIILVAHKRKNNFSDNGNDEIMGSSDISNLMAVNLSYEKDRGKNAKCRPDQRLLKVFKARLFGETNESGIVLDFDEGSKRVYYPGQHSNLNENYGWNVATEDGFVSAEDNMEIPF